MKDNIKRVHMEAAHVYAKLSYCKRRQVGCIIVKDNRIISIGYNGTPPGWENICEDEHGDTFPYVYHAEANAISKLARSHESGEAASVFITTAPCFECAKFMAQVGICEVFYADLYKDENGIAFLKKCGIHTEMLSPRATAEEDNVCNTHSNSEREGVGARTKMTEPLKAIAAKK